MPYFTVRGPVPLAAGSSLLLDSISATPTVALSTRKLRSAYAGSAYEAADFGLTVFQDIGFVADDLDTASLLTFSAANSNQATVRKWYDQSGNGRNLTTGAGLAVAAVQNLTTVNSHPALRRNLDNAGSFALATSNFVTASALSCFVAYDIKSFSAIGAEDGGVFGDQGNGFISLNGCGTNVSNVAQTTLFDGADKTAKINTATGAQVILTTFGAGTISIYLNGGTPVTTASGNISDLTKNATYGNNAFDASVLELLVFNTKISNADANIIGASLATRAGVSWTNI